VNRREPTTGLERVNLYWQPTRIKTSTGAWLSAEWTRVWYSNERDLTTLAHGSYSTYTNHRCRCPDCKAVAKIVNRQVRRRRAERLKARP
jgi:hypothetical protein